MFNLERVPNRKKDTFAWADYVELCCLTEPDKAITVADISDSVDEDEEFNLDSDIYIEGEGNAEQDDRLEAYVIQYMEYIKSRKNLFRDGYPFDVSQNKIELKSDLTPKQVSYLFLLLFSCLRNIDEKHREPLTTSFEVIVGEFFSQLLSENGSAYVVSSKNKELGSTAFERIEWVAAQLGTSIICSPKEFKGNIAGEKGLDIVAWLDLGDGLVNRPVFLVQATCGASTTFGAKAAQVSPDKWMQILKFNSMPLSVLCVPHSFRDEAHELESDVDFGRALFIDRSRILNHVADFEPLLESETFSSIRSMIFGSEKSVAS